MRTISDNCGIALVLRDGPARFRVLAVAVSIAASASLASQQKVGILGKETLAHRCRRRRMGVCLPVPPPRGGAETGLERSLSEAALWRAPIETAKTSRPPWPAGAPRECRSLRPCRRGCAPRQDPLVVHRQRRLLRREGLHRPAAPVLPRAAGNAAFSAAAGRGRKWRVDRRQLSSCCLLPTHHRTRLSPSINTPGHR